MKSVAGSFVEGKYVQSGAGQVRPWGLDVIVQAGWSRMSTEKDNTDSKLLKVIHQTGYKQPAIHAKVAASV